MNHDWTMREGLRGLRRELKTRRNERALDGSPPA
jgi:hypothetical protein